MKIHIATEQLLVLETENGDLADGDSAQEIIRAVLEENGFEQWSSIEIEDYTYRNSGLLFAKPIKVYIPGFMARLTN
jgi:hypothetical protein